LMFFLVRYLAPIFVFIVLIVGIDHTYFGDTLGKLLGIVKDVAS